jgi:2,4-dienoyl-CoA reductase-like NADH-dependent reductase (Old Yellow Enzyme family)/thioredoxin reductase
MYLQGGFRMQNVILQPIEVGGQTFKNRIMFPPLTTGYEKNGMISEQDMGFYTRLAKGGVGYIVLGDVAPINSFSPTPKLFDDSQIPAFKALADSVHAYGTKLGVQLFHPEYDVDAINSLFMQKKFDEMRQRLHHDMMFFTDEVSEEMLMAIIDKMCACAVRAQKAGVDVIQIHGDRLNGCLCSTRMNHRTDKFGGSLENRVRFARMLTRAIRKAVPDMVIDYKLSIVTPQRGKGGIDEADAVQFAQWLVEDGVDMFHVAQANHTGNMADTIPPMGVQPYGFFVKIAGDIKKAVNVPVSAVGRIVDAEMAARVIESGMADIVAMGRPLLADPDWGTKIAAGKACDIRRCISCNKGCTDAIQNRQFLSCVLNAENGYENTRSIQPAAQKKKIAVLGGGPAGLEAARVAALRGHDVTLFEKTTTLGGQLNIACVPPRKEEMRRAAQDLIHAVCNAGVHLCMGQTRTAEQLKDAGFEAVINAVGAHSAAPRIPGIDSVNVADAWKVLAGEQQVYGTVAVIGGGMVGCETAEYLAARGCKVSVIEMMDKIAAGESSTILPTLLENYKTYGVEQYPSHKVKEFRMDAVVCENKDGAEVTIPCDYIVLAMGARSNEFDAAALEAASIPVYSIGDAAGKAADISNAIRTGYDTACQL